MSFQKAWISFFILISVVYLLFSLLNFGEAIVFLKPLLLLPLLAAAFFSGHFYHKGLLFTALTFCWAGDILLLFAPGDPLFFIGGLAAFLTGHVFFIILFAKMISGSGSKLQLRLPVVSFIVFYLVAFYAFLSPHLDTMLFPVMGYAIVISVMLYFAVLLRAQLPKTNSVFLLCGAISFIISDSILAINKFYTAVPMSGFLIMFTYLFAQGAIVSSLLITKPESSRLEVLQP